jgi:formaldehyde dismutase / methanol dehydrogenase
MGEDPLGIAHNDHKREVVVIAKNIAEFPVIYTNVIPRIALGWGAYETAADECKNAGIKNALIVTSGLRGTGIVDEIRGSLNYHGIATEIYDKVTSNPKDYQIVEALNAFTKAGCDGIVAIGGGSSIDTGKAVRVLAANPDKELMDCVAQLDPPFMETLKNLNPCTVPEIAVVTTSGTGSEVTSWAAITNTKTRTKVLVSAPNVNCTVAIVDPLLIRLQPRNVAAWTGFDAMAHGLEAFVTKVQGPYGRGLLLDAVKLIAENIRTFTFNRMDSKACEAMATAATMCGMAIGFGAGAGIVHGLGHQISALTDVHHGRINAVLALASERYNQPACAEKLAALAGAMGADTRGLTVWQASDKWFDEIERLLQDLEITPGHVHEQFGLEKEDIPRIAKVYSNDFCSQGNPKPYHYDEVVKLLESVY